MGFTCALHLAADCLYAHSEYRPEAGSGSRSGHDLIPDVGVTSRDRSRRQGRSQTQDQREESLDLCYEYSSIHCGELHDVDKQALVVSKLRFS